MLLRNGLVLDENFHFIKQDILIEGGRFTEISAQINCDRAGKEMNVIDVDGAFVVPGLVDIHVHGADGEDYSNADRESLEKIARRLASLGTTSFLAASLSMHSDRLMQLYSMTADYRAQQKSVAGAAKLEGLYMEGPYLSFAKRGSQDDRFLKQPDMEEFKKLQAASGNAIKIISIAPELQGAMEFITKAASPENEMTVILSIAHTGCDYQQAKMALESGATHITHLYNGMLPFHHRKPGILGAVSDNSSVTVELICDGVHVHPAAARIALRLVSEDRMILISDGLAPMGCINMPHLQTEFDFGERKVILNNGRAQLEDGTLAGSVTDLLQCVKNAVKFGFETTAAFKAATINPAKKIGMENEIGSIAVGKRADFLILDRNFNLSSVYIDGTDIRNGHQS